MKISDPIGKVYQHSMFKKKSYNIPNGGDSDILDRSRAHSDEEDEDEVSDVSEQSDDSLSTKSSRIVPSSRRARTRSTSRHRRSDRRDEEDGARERDREDAISYASRNNERGDRRRSSSRKGSKRSSSTKKYGLENIGPSGTSYSLWTSRKSLKRDHKRKFNRSMCGVLLGVSVVLVVLGILGIIGIAVYLGVVQKIESPERDLVSIDGAFRVVSEDFSLSLLNPSSLDYKEQEEKYTRILSKTYRKSMLNDALVKIVIDGFSSGSIKVFFKVILDKSKIPEPIQQQPVMATKDVLMQEVMSLDRSEFQDTIIDIDSIDFSLSKVQDVKVLEPEPFQGEKQETTTQSVRPQVVNLGGGGGSLWQNLAQSTARPPLRTTEQEQGWPPASASASDRMDTEDTYSAYNGEPVPLNANGWSLPRYPTNTMYDYGRPNNLLPQQFPNIVTPETPVIISPHNGRQKLSSFGLPPQLPPVLPSFPPRRKNSMLSVDNDVSSRPDASGGLMSEYMEPPPPPPPSSREESLNSLESLFGGGGSNPSPIQSMSPSETYFKMTPKPQPQTQNRRIDIADDGDKYNGFWKMLHKPERKQQNPKMPSQQFHQRKSSAKAESITSMQQELEHLLMLESQQNKGGANLYDQIQMMDDDEIKQLADKMAHILEPQNNNQKNYQPTMNPWRSKPPSRNQDPVSINNFGSSGLKKVMTSGGNNDIIRGSSTTHRPTTVVDFTVPKGQSTGFFGVGSSLSFGGGGGQNIVQSPQMRSQAQASNTNSIMNSVGSLNSDQLIQSSAPMGSDPNIVYPSQIRPGTQMLQGPQGPIVSSPRPLSLAVPQTPLAPQLPNPGGYQEFPDHYPGSRSSSGQRPVSSTRRPPGTLRLVTSGSAPGGQLRQKQTFQQTRGETQQGVRRTGAPGASDRQDIIGNILPAAMGLSGSAGISPIGIFSNLLNAYATIDSKHDLTGKLINSAASWLTPEVAEVRTTDVGGPTTTTPTSTTSSPPSTSSSQENTTSRRDKPVTNVSVRVNEDPSDESQYQSIFDKIRAAANSKDSEYDIVTNYETDLPPMKSNIFADGPLRPKPPSEDIIQVSPAPHDYSYDKDEPPLQYAVGNPNWYSNEIQASTAGYGPDDFIVETVNLDKNFFYQFFTSKPMIIDTDVVTSTSVKVKHDIKPKTGRDTKTDLLMKSSRETLMNLPEHLIGKDILPNHILKKTGEAFVDDEMADNEQEDDALELVQFKRYNLPAEIQITSGTGNRRGKELESESAEESE